MWHVLVDKLYIWSWGRHCQCWPGYLEDVYLIRLYPRHFYQITRELFSTDLSDEAYHSIHIPFLPANIFSKQSVVVSPKAEVRLWCYCCLRCAGENSWSVISVKYQQTAWWHFNLNFDKLSYFGQKCKHWQGQGSRQVLLIYFFFYQQGGSYPEHSPRHIIRPLDRICHLTFWHVPEISNVFLARPCHWCEASNVCTCLCQIWLMYF